MATGKSPGPQPLFIYLLLLHLVALAVITFIAYVASSTRSDCNVSSSSSSTTGIVDTAQKCTLFERISSFLRHNASYIQAIHTHLSQNIVMMALIIYKPFLTAMVWSALASRTLTLENFRRNIDLVHSPGLGYLANYIKKHPPALSFPVIFVVTISILSQLSTFAVSPVYRPHQGPYSTNATIVNGGGIDSTMPTFFDSFDAATPKGVTIGKTLVSGMAVANIGVPTSNTYLDLLPFIPPKSIQAIWDGNVNTVVARSSLDCSSSAATNLTNNNITNLLVPDPSSYFAPNGSVRWANPHPSFVGENLGALGNEPQLVAVYLNGSYMVGSGFVTGNASVIFAAANGTMEGAQLTITSPNPTSRIRSVDVLVCASTTRLEVSTCTIKLGTVTSCNPNPQLVSSSNSSMGGVDMFVQHPGDVAITLAVAPVIAIPYWYNAVPSYDINPDIIMARVLPLPYLTTGETRPPYSIPLSYVQDVLFGQTARFMVQGIISDVGLQTHSQQQIALTATFGTSNPILIYLIMGLGILICSISIVAFKVAGQPSSLDTIHLLSISKSAKLNELLNKCAEDPDLLQNMIAYNEETDQLMAGSEDDTIKIG